MEKREKKMENKVKCNIKRKFSDIFSRGNDLNKVYKGNQKTKGIVNYAAGSIVTSNRQEI